MLSRGKRVGETVWVVFMLVSYWTLYGSSPEAQGGLYGGVMAFQLVGCYFVAKNRGRHGIWILVGLVPLVCIGLPFFLPSTDPSDARGTSRRRRSIAVGLGMVVLAIGVTVGATCESIGRGSHPIPQSAWRPFTLGALRVLVPVALQSVPNPLGALPPEDRSQYEAVTVHKGSTARGDFLVTVSSSAIGGDWEWDVDGYLDGVFRAAAARAGGQAEQVQVNATTCSGLTARRGRCVVTRDRDTLNVDAVAVFSGRTVTQVLVVHSALGQEDADRVLESVQLATGAPR